MAKIILNDVNNINSLSVINDNFDKIEDALQDGVLWRDNPEGETNTVEQDIDLNGFRLLNVGAVVPGTESFPAKYLGAFVSDPVVGLNGELLSEGMLYFRTGIPTKALMLFNGSNWVEASPTTINVLSSLSPAIVASPAEINAGVETSKAITPFGLQATLTSNTGATLVGWIKAATGAVSYTLGTWLGWQKPNVLEFMSTAQRIDYLAGTGSLDVTAAVQAAETASTSAGRLLEWPGGCALITDTISRATGSQWVGEHRNKGLPGFINGTKIKFQPASAKYLCAPAGAPALYRVGYSTVGFHIEGNSASAVGNSIAVMDVHGINKSTFADLTITGFRRGFRLYATIDNAFDKVAINNTYVESVLYDGGVSTTDVWDKCYFANSPIWVQTNGANLGIRFINPTVESITTYGMNLVKESWGFDVVNPYLEDVPSANVSTNAAFRVGYDGTTLSNATQLKVHGGVIGGRNAGGVGSAFDVDSTDGIDIGGFYVTRYTNVVKTSTNTLTNQVVARGWTSTSISTQVTDDTKVTGFWGAGVTNSASRNQQTYRLSGDQFTGTATPCTGAITTSSAWKLTKDGIVVTLTLPSVVGTATAAPSFTFGEVLPAKYRPSASLVYNCAIRDNGANLATPGMILIDYLTGGISVYKDSTGTSNFTNAASSGLGQGCGTTISWAV